MRTHTFFGLCDELSESGYKRGIVRRDWGAGEGGNQQPAFGWSDRNPVF